MKTKFVFVVFLCCVALSLVMHSALAQKKNARVGTTAAPWLLIPVGARDMALGGSSLATATGIEAVHWNPAGLGRLAGSAEAMFSQMSYIADIDMIYGGVGGKFGDFGTVALTVKSLNVGDIPLTTEVDPEALTGRSFRPTFVSVGVTYARSITDAISFGVTGKLITEQIDRVSASGFAFDFGIQYRSLVGVQGLELGVALKNVGTQMQYDGTGLYRDAVGTTGSRPFQRYKSVAASSELPALVEVGLAYEGRATDNVVWGVSGTFSNNNLYYDEFRLGGEVGYTWEALRVFGRGGYHALAQYQDDNIFGASFGFGVSYGFTGMDITLDYAYRQVEFFNANQVVSVKFGF